MIDKQALSQALAALKQSAESLCQLIENDANHEDSANLRDRQWTSNAAHAEAIAETIQVLDQSLMRVITPEDYLHRHVIQFQQLSCLHWACQFGILQHVPLHGSIGLSEVAAKASVPERTLQSVIAMLTTDSFFELTAGDEYVQQSALSRSFAENEFLRDWISFMVGYSLPTAMSMTEASKQWDATATKNKTAYALAMGTDLPFFDHLSRDPTELRRFKSYMSSIAKSDALSTRHVLSAMDWNSIPDGSTVVDIGGSSGHVSRTLVTAYSHLRPVVQDLPDVIAAQSDGQHHPNITFQSHDFFDPQPIQGASVYLLRTILHDWPDAEAIATLNHIADAMEPASRIIIMNIVLPASGSALQWQEAKLRSRDVTMMQTFNSHERSAAEWRSLVAKLDRHLESEIWLCVGGGTLSCVQLRLA